MKGLLILQLIYNTKGDMRNLIKALMVSSFRLHVLNFRFCRPCLWVVLFIRDTHSYRKENHFAVKIPRDNS
ncbi:hypothetical protein MKW98_000998 [Papaver atlanticum]|uniref:Uncharacterized protein n=1 Tax=Papaver atlanticum TaxID=357466 RepID=A0AAD4XDI9_9MAGN|nr:hypothetical protein MKW98_000998 [Papaver atlanticum]